MTPTRFALWFALAIGTLDLLSGVGLVCAPTLTLRLMFIAQPDVAALPFVRFVGAFVAAVGLCYLWAVRKPATRLRPVLGATIFFRLTVGTYAAAGAGLGWLPVGWLLVAGADFAIIAIQGWLLAKGAGHHA
ncbi:MAG: hypothetical protein HZA31_09330 [Opitutae bacterium]|nr:hypothetical protein [Opitutae bacterium]